MNGAVSTRGFVTLPVLVALLVAGVAIGIATKTPSSASQAAASGISLTTNKGAPDSCTAAIDKAVAAQGENDGTVTTRDVGTFETQDSCFGAILKPGSKTPYKAADYTCTGRGGTVTITKDGSTAVTTAQQGTTMGHCNITKVNGSDPSQALGGDGQPKSADEIMQELSATDKDVSLLEAKQASAEQGVGEFTPQDQQALNDLKNYQADYKSEIERIGNANEYNAIDAMPDQPKLDSAALNPNITDGNNTSILKPEFADTGSRSTGFNQDFNQRAPNDLFNEATFKPTQSPGSSPQDFYNAANQTSNPSSLANSFSTGQPGWQSAAWDPNTWNGRGESIGSALDQQNNDFANRFGTENNGTLADWSRGYGEAVSSPRDGNASDIAGSNFSGTPDARFIGGENNGTLAQWNQGYGEAASGNPLGGSSALDTVAYNAAHSDPLLGAFSTGQTGWQAAAYDPNVWNTADNGIYPGTDQPGVAQALYGNDNNGTVADWNKGYGEAVSGGDAMAQAHDLNGGWTGMGEQNLTPQEVDKALANNSPGNGYIDQNSPNENVPGGQYMGPEPKDAFGSNPEGNGTPLPPSDPRKLAASDGGTPLPTPRPANIDQPDNNPSEQPTPWLQHKDENGKNVWCNDVECRSSPPVENPPLPPSDPRKTPAPGNNGNNNNGNNNNGNNNNGNGNNGNGNNGNGQQQGGGGGMPKMPQMPQGGGGGGQGSGGGGSPQPQQNSCGLVQSFLLGCPQTTCTITASPQNVQPTYGQQVQPVTLQWQAPNAQYASITGLGAVPPTGSTIVYPTVSTNYLMQVYGKDGTQQTCQTSVTIQPSTQQAPYGRGTDGNPCAAPPPQPSASQCTTGTWKPLSATNGCLTNWQCVPTNPQCPTQPAQPSQDSCKNGFWNATYQSGTTCITGWRCDTQAATSTPATSTPPVAHMACSTSVADVGSNLGLSWTCDNSESSDGVNFSTGGALSGSTSTVVAKPSTGNTQVYGVSCHAGQATVTDQCSVQVVQPSIFLVASPKKVPPGGATVLGWVTTGMKQCVISTDASPDFNEFNKNATSTTGTAVTPSLGADTDFTLTCQTLGGGVKVATTTVMVDANLPPTSIDISSSIDGNAAVQFGSVVRINWTTGIAPQNSAIALWVYDETTHLPVALIQGRLPLDGSWSWQTPRQGAPCTADESCVSDFPPGHKFDIEATLYSPTDADLLGTSTSTKAKEAKYVDFNWTPAFQFAQ